MSPRQPMALPAPMEAMMLRGGVVLTPNQRVARRLTAAFNRRRVAEGKASWTPATVLPWHAWTAACWTELLVAGQEERVLLNDVQERALWQSVIAEDGRPELAEAGALPEMCTRAHRLLAGYLALYRLPAYLSAASADAQTYGRWLRSFRDRCNDGGLLPSAELEAALAVAIRLKRGRWKPAAEFAIFGFDDLLPSQQAVVRALESRGCAVVPIDACEAMQADAPVLVAAPDDRTELQACAAWVRQRLEQHSDGSVALIVPDLTESAPEIERVLREVVAPEFEDIGLDEGAVPWHIAAGRPLLELPMIGDALRMLRWWAGPLAVTEIGALLLSPYLTVADGEMRGAAIDACTLRSLKLRRTEMSMAETAERSVTAEPIFTKRLQELARMGRFLDRKRSFAGWCERARDLLRRAGWPGTRQCNSDEFQMAERWDEALDRVASLDLLGAEVGFGDFVQTLMQCCADTLFARADTGASIQVMSPAEAAGSTADALWFLHGTEAAWSSRQSLHPLLPVPLQRKFTMPGTDPVRDAERLLQLTRRLANSAREVRFSYAEMGEDGAQRPSTEILALQALARETAKPEEQEAVRPTLEVVDDLSAMPALPDAVVRGGVKVLESQAACPFRAFAEMRLFSTEVEERPLGLDRRDQGNLVHKALEKFWLEMQSQPALLASAAEFVDGRSKRDRLLQRCVDETFGPVPEEAWEAEYIAVQKRRLFQLLRRWLEKEAERPAFEVLQVEQSAKDVRVGPLRIDVRVDRVDRVGGGEDAATVLIDYKTGRVQPKDWEGDRLEAPQLPVYAIAAGLPDVGAVAFASVRAGTANLWMDGWPSQSPHLPPRKRQNGVTDFAEQRARWSVVLANLAQQFADGDASVDPKDYPVTCKDCGQRLLCRLDPAALLAVRDQDDYPDEDAAS